MTALTPEEQARVAIVERRLVEEQTVIQRTREFEAAAFSDLGEQRRELTRLRQQRLDIRSSDGQYIEFLLALVKRLQADDDVEREAKG